MASAYDDLIGTPTTTTLTEKNPYGDIPGVTDADYAGPAAAAPVTQTEEPGIMQQGSRSDSFARGFANASSFGIGKWANALSEEVGIGAAAAELIGGSTSPGRSRWESAYDQLFPNHNNGKSFWADITGSVEEEKAANRAAFEAHPAYNIAGAVAPTIITLGATRGAGLPTTLAGKTAVGGGLGAFTGLTESTTVDQAKLNVPVGAVLGGLLSAVPAGVQTVLNKVGKSGAVKSLGKLIDDLKSQDDAIVQKALAKAHSLFAGKGTTTFNEKDLLEAAKAAKDLLTTTSKKEWDKIGGDPSHIVGPVVSKLAPSVGEVAKDVVDHARDAAVSTAAGHVLTGGSNWGTAAGAASSLLTSSGRKLAGDAANYGAQRFAGSAATQAASNAAPYAIGPMAGQYAQPMGLSGVLGQYIENTWAKK